MEYLSTTSKQQPIHPNSSPKRKLIHMPLTFKLIPMPQNPFTQFLIDIFTGQLHTAHLNPEQPSSQFAHGLYQGFMHVPPELRSSLIQASYHTAYNPITHFMEPSHANPSQYPQPPYAYGIFSAFGYIFKNHWALLNAIVISRIENEAKTQRLDYDLREAYGQNTPLTQTVSQLKRQIQDLTAQRDLLTSQLAQKDQQLDEERRNQATTRAESGTKQTKIQELTALLLESQAQCHEVLEISLDLQRELAIANEQIHRPTTPQPEIALPERPPTPTKRKKQKKKHPLVSAIIQNDRDTTMTILRQLSNNEVMALLTKETIRNPLLTKCEEDETWNPVKVLLKEKVDTHLILTSEGDKPLEHQLLTLFGLKHTPTGIMDLINPLMSLGCRDCAVAKSTADSLTN